MKSVYLQISKYTIRCVILSVLCTMGCTGKQGGSERTSDIAEKIKTPSFNVDSAYSFIAKQVGFGPRIPNTEAHERTGMYLTAMCKKYGAEVIVQQFSTRAYNGELLSLNNIIASYGPEKQKRILLAAHWDTRPFADKDTQNPTATFDGANDGASGVGVLLEVARLFGQGVLPAVGVDIIFFDGEDFGEPEGISSGDPPSGWDSWWCLGSQYWSKNKHKPNYSAYYGILLDMVGGQNAQFVREGFSFDHAPRIINKVWSAAAQLGYKNYFSKTNAPGILDDHIYVNEWAKIPMIDIVHYEPGVGYFGPHHHSQGDNMSIISRETLEAVGKTLLYVVYNESE